jgi:hypothetical protein
MNIASVKTITTFNDKRIFVSPAGGGYERKQLGVPPAVLNNRAVFAIPAFMDKWVFVMGTGRFVK